MKRIRWCHETWFYAANDDVRRQLDLQDRMQVAKDSAGTDITVIGWAQEERNKFHVIATKAWEDTAAMSPEAKVALDAHYPFMKTIGLLDQQLNNRSATCSSTGQSPAEHHVTNFHRTRWAVERFYR